ncbi:MAG: glycosyltransferase [candidate division Zixibacteria bacterium]|nr:glycosyltransferase [candidate division Zixibacteria bacterium]
MSKKACVIIPTYNEKENIERITNAVLKQDERLSVLVVDDNSPDGTGQIADRKAEENARVMVLHREAKSGLGQAYIAGFKYTLKKGFDYILEMDADFSHDPKYLPDFLKTIENYDLVLGSRYIPGGGVVNWPADRIMISKIGNIYARIITGMPVADATGGFKCFRREVLEAIDFDEVRSNGYSFQIEMSFRAYKKGFRIKEIPITFKDREDGTSKMSKKIVREAIVMVPRLKLWSLTGKLK